MVIKVQFLLTFCTDRIMEHEFTHPYNCDFHLIHENWCPLMLMKPVNLPIRLLCLSSNFCSTLVLNLAASSSLAKFSPAWAVCKLELKQIIQNILKVYSLQKIFFLYYERYFFYLRTNLNNICLKYLLMTYFFLLDDKQKQAI